MKMKYPRTLHLPWSLGKTSDDKVLKTTKNFENNRVVVTEKIDGENTTLYRHGLHARSLDGKDHPSRHWVKKMHGNISYLIPEQYRVCGENVFAKHSIYYEHLESYFYMFSIWNEHNMCLSWEETMLWSEELKLPLPPVLYDGIWDEEKIKQLFTGKSSLGETSEGYVVRIADEFHYDDFGASVAKFVRQNHVQTSNNWLNQEVVTNKVISE